MPELLAPAGNWDCLRAAIANGADAVYFGLPRFNARLRADNFADADLPAVVDFCHRHGVKAFLALNVLVFTDELEEASQAVLAASRAGVDALIVQDIGLARLARSIAPDLPLHASTQMTITSPEGGAFAAELGMERIVLARELSLREIERFKAYAPEKEGIPDLEVFVHGALCVAYSGQCLTSEALGHRSANRGECAQACRMPYSLIVDGAPRDLGDKRYLLSPQDLAAVEEIPALVRLGVLSYKIEGRLKEPEYVAAITRIYRKAIDAAAAAESGNGKPVLSKRDRYTMEMVFSRGLYSGWMHGVNHQELVHGEFGKKRGPFVGTVLETGPDYVHLDTIRCPLKPGDGVVFENPADTNREQGGRLFHIQGARLTFGRSLVDLRSVRPGTRVWKTDDPALQAELRKTYAGRLGMRALPVNATIRGAAGEAFVLELETPEGIRATAESRTPLQPARNRPLTPESVRAQIERFGEFPFKLGDSYFHLQGEVILPISEINDVRRRAAEALWRRLRPARREYISDDRWKSMLEEDVSVAQPAPAQEPELAVLCRTQEHVETCIAAGIRRIYLDFEDVRRYASAVDHVRSTHPNVEVFLATPRIQKSGEQGFFRLIENAHPHGVLVRNLGAISFFRESPLTLVGDFSLNAANPLTVGWFMRKGMSAVTISYDLNEEQVLALVRSVPAAWLELTLHQHMPLFHMEHCVFAAFMSNGRDFTDCGRPCEKHRVHLRDRTGVAHPLRADAGCRNTLFHATPQTGASMYETFLSAGLRRFRVELLEETGRDLGRILDSYQALIRGEISGTGLWKKLHASNRLGVTRGTLVSGTRSV